MRCYKNAVMRMICLRAPAFAPSPWRPNIRRAGIDRGKGTSPCCQMLQAAQYRMISCADQLHNDRCSIVLQTRSLHGLIPLQSIVAMQRLKSGYWPVKPPRLRRKNRDGRDVLLSIWIVLSANGSEGRKDGSHLRLSAQCSHRDTRRLICLAHAGICRAANKAPPEPSRKAKMDSADDGSGRCNLKFRRRSQTRANGLKVDLGMHYLFSSSDLVITCIRQPMSAQGRHQPGHWINCAINRVSSGARRSGEARVLT
jgi:hypothetical protein